MSKVNCFLVSKLDLARRVLRRYRGSDPCPGPMGYHNAQVTIEDNVPFESPWNGTADDTVPHDDPRWPQQCACGYVFIPEDNWQSRLERLWEHPGTGERFPLQHGEMPVGAMFFSDWHGDGKEHLQVITPGGQWDIDGPANNGPGWTRTGEAPLVTAHPSILIGSKYHGWLRNGVLEEC